MYRPIDDLENGMVLGNDGEQGFTLYQKDIIELAKDYGIKEEELNG